MRPGLFDQGRLFGDVGVEARPQAGSHRRAAAAGVLSVCSPMQACEVVADLEPGALVHRLLLAPRRLPGRGSVAARPSPRGGIELFHARWPRVVAASRRPPPGRSTLPLHSTTRRTAWSAISAFDGGVRDDRLETAGGEVVQGRHRQLVRSSDFGVITTSGLRQSRTIWRRIVEPARRGQAHPHVVRRAAAGSAPDARNVPAWPSP